MHAAARRFDGISIRFGELIMSGPRLVSDESRRNRIVDETRHERLGIRQNTAAIVAHVDNQSFRQRERG